MNASEATMTRAILTRHTIRPSIKSPESANYPGISEEGVLLAQERARELKSQIDETPQNAIIFIGGASESPRAKSTAILYGDELKNVYNGDPTTIVMTYADVQQGPTIPKMLEKIHGIIAAHPDSRIIIDYPLFLRELSLERSGIVNHVGNDTPYIAKLFELNYENEFLAVRQWIAENDPSDPLKQPAPVTVAKGYLNALIRLREFAQPKIGDRPLTIIMVGHSFGLDALFTYLAGNGNVTSNAFARISQIDGDEDLIRPTEPALLTLNDNGIQLNYRNKMYTSTLTT